MLSQFYFTMVDDADFEWLSQRKWCVDRCQGGLYAARRTSENGKARKERMHRAILKAPPGVIVDHINGNTLDNRRSNLRVCSHTENLQNMTSRSGTSRFKGVGWHKARRKWAARIVVNGRHVYLGYFENERKAAEAYDAASLKYFGPFARPNFPVHQPETSRKE